MPIAIIEYDAIITPSIELASLVFLLNIIRLSLPKWVLRGDVSTAVEITMCAACHGDGLGLLKIPGGDIFFILREWEFFSRF